MTVYNNDDIMNAVESVENYISQLSTKITKLEGMLDNVTTKLNEFEGIIINLNESTGNIETRIKKNNKKSRKKIDSIYNREYSDYHWKHPSSQKITQTNSNYVDENDPLVLAMASDDIIKLDEDATPFLRRRDEIS